MMMSISESDKNYLSELVQLDFCLNSLEELSISFWLDMAETQWAIMLLTFAYTKNLQNYRKHNFNDRQIQDRKRLADTD